MQLSEIWLLFLLLQVHDIRKSWDFDSISKIAMKVSIARNVFFNTILSFPSVLLSLV